MGGALVVLCDALTVLMMGSAMGLCVVEGMFGYLRQ